MENSLYYIYLLINEIKEDIYPLIYIAQPSSEKYR